MNAWAYDAEEVRTRLVELGLVFHERTANAETWLQPTSKKVAQMPLLNRGVVWMFELDDAWAEAGLLKLDLSPFLV